jgi:hypothetical protein
VADLTTGDATPDPKAGIVYRYFSKLPAGSYTYRFAAQDVDGAATGRPTRTKSGPTVGGGASAMVLTALAAEPAPAGAQITFTLTSAAHVDARILNVAGRPVKRLCSARPLDGGANALLWDARSDAGLPVPNGVYIAEVAAKGEDGSQARAVTPVRISR